MLKVAAFDFDGTLADSVDFCLAVFDKVFAKYMGENAPSREEIYQNFGMNEPGVLRYFMGRTVLEAEAEFIRLHRELHPQMCPALFAGIRELLLFLKEKHVELVLLTGRGCDTAAISLEYLGIKEFFSLCYFGAPEKNDKTGQLLHLCQTRQLKKEELVYVGDALSDAQASARAGIKCFSAAWAKSARIAELEKTNPGLVFKSVRDLQEHFAAELAG